MRSHELAPPDAAFGRRLRALSDAAGAMRDSHARALKGGLAWRPVKSSDGARPPYELRPGTGRRGPEHLWARFDAAVDQLNQAGAGDSLADVVAAYAAVSEAAGALADALEAAGQERDGCSRAPAGRPLTAGWAAIGRRRAGRRPRPNPGWRRHRSTSRRARLPTARAARRCRRARR